MPVKTETRDVSHPSEEIRTGIPWAKILDRVGKTQVYTGEVEGRSGRPLRYFVKPHKIGISDAVDPESFFMMSYVLSARDTISFSLATRNFDGIPELRHPDFSAREFVGFALRYFGDHGYDVTKFQAEWLRANGSDNFDSFMEEFGRTGDRVRAARNTWSGRVLGGHGFTKIRNKDIIITGDDVTATFHSPKPPLSLVR